MSLPMMIYGLILALLVAAAAHFIDRGLRSLRRPTRWVWVAALMVGGLAPFIPKLITSNAPQTSTDLGLPLGGLGLPIEPIYQVGTTGTSGPETVRQFLLAMERSLGVLWILASVLVLAVIAGGWLRLRRQRKAWETRSVGGEDVLLTDSLGPAVLGLFRPRIVLPQWALALPKKDLELVLLHEREHQDARDPALLGACLLLTAVAPWNPALWWSLRRLRLAVEGDCDGRVLARGVAPRSYVRLLIEIASRAGRAPALAPALAEAGETSLRKRLIMIRSTFAKNRVWAAALAAAAGAALLVVACETPVPQESRDVANANFSVTQTEVAGRLAAAVESNWITREQAGAIAEEMRGVQHRLQASVEAGEMTREEASDGYRRAEYGAFAKAVRERVAAGALTEKQGRAAVEAYVVAGVTTEHEAQLAYQDPVGEVRERRGVDALRGRLLIAVESSWITREQAGAIAEEMRDVEHRLQASVEAGEMTREEAGDEHRRAEYGAIDKAVRERVAAGALTEKEGSAALKGYVSLASGRTGD